MLRIIAFALMIALAAPAAAQVTGSTGTFAPPSNPKLKELVYVSSEIVRIGDLVDNAGASASIAVFRSPDLGYTGGVPLARVMAALAPYRLASLDTGNISEVVVTRMSRAITGKEIETKIARALAGQFGFTDAKNISIVFDRDVRTIHIDPTATEDLQVARVYVDQRTGRFSIAFELPGGTAAHRTPLRFSGTAIETLEAAVLVRSLNNGDIIKPSDVVTERRPKADIVDGFVSTDGAIGLAAKRPLRSGVALHPADLMKPEAVHRNEFVTITYEIPGIMLTARGKALEAGSIGDIVGVLNTQSNRTVQATVIGPGRVSIATALPAPVATSAINSEPSNPTRQNTE